MTNKQVYLKTRTGDIDLCTENRKINFFNGNENKR